ncbi:hypothetical protein M3Y99_01562400 [Aphelenchoides fujianensis]|nr:hypothetical protein M3Y99_01562400 [Aphelenchoides fujianensis]
MDDENAAAFARLKTGGNGRLYALKAEPHGQEAAVKQLKRDVLVLVDALKRDARSTRHLPRLHSKGRVDGVCNYVIMTLADFNLDDLRRRELKGADFS